MTTEFHDQFYSKARYYDIAFNFKNVEEENTTVLGLFHAINGRKPLSFLDIAAGPAANAIEMAQRGIRSYALDCSQEMVEYGKNQAQQKGQELEFIRGDMRDFHLPEKVDLVAIFMDSLAYLHTNQDVIDHLRAVARNLTDNGIYILEMSHPRDVFSVGKSTENEWTVEQDGITVTMKWGDSRDQFDPIRQITNVTARLSYKSAIESGEVVDQSSQRCFTFNEISALVEASGCFELVKVVGSLKPNVEFSNSPECWRMVPVLKRRIHK